MTLPPYLLAPILACPEDDLPRLIAADWLEENGLPQWAEFIRLQIEFAEHRDRQRLISRRICTLVDSMQVPAKMLGIGPNWIWSGDCESVVVKPHGEEIEYVFRRGLVDEIRCQMAQWVGSICQNCDGTGKDAALPGPEWEKCICHGTGRTAGIAGRVMEQWPVRTVVLTDKSPMDASDGYSWHLPDHLHREQLPFELPKCIYWKLKASKKFNKFGSKMDGLVVYPTEKRAHAALSSAAIAFGLREAGRE